MQAVLQQIARHGIAESIEEIGADAHEREVDPRLVADEVCKGLEGELLRPDGLQAFLGEEAAGQRAQRGQRAHQDADYGILVRIGAAGHFLQVREGKQGDEAHGIGAHHAERGELVLLIVVVGHHA